jgi:hypothetical protein
MIHDSEEKDMSCHDALMRWEWEGGASSNEQRDLAHAGRAKTTPTRRVVSVSLVSRELQPKGRVLSALGAAQVISPAASAVSHASNV